MSFLFYRMTADTMWRCFSKRHCHMNVLLSEVFLYQQ
ncbi:hypothetical protein RUMOBE_02244 [Blautia obeum ATCC 29174]|uniref:Uncharacterized protein n=1 Tax=Blautia obeum ATCC 29174 TaxID=411459 RepID=A5ZTB5_9FIRM|nr:hypothetical protein RUMOBE_02244 [Blautia obeum ATCC 29174]